MSLWWTWAGVSSLKVSSRAGGWHLCGVLGCIIGCILQPPALSCCGQASSAWCNCKMLASVVPQHRCICVGLYTSLHIPCTGLMVHASSCQSVLLCKLWPVLLSSWFSLQVLLPVTYLTTCFPHSVLTHGPMQDCVRMCPRPLQRTSSIPVRSMCGMT